MSNTYGSWVAVSPLTPQSSSSRVIRSPLRQSYGVDTSPTVDCTTRVLNFSAGTSLEATANPNRRSETRPPSEPDSGKMDTAKSDLEGSFDSFSATLAEVSSKLFFPATNSHSPFAKYAVPRMTDCEVDNTSVGAPESTTAYILPHQYVSHHHSHHSEVSVTSEKSAISEGSLTEQNATSLRANPLQWEGFVESFTGELESKLRLYAQELKDKSNQLSRLEAHLRELEKSFHYNEGVISERDSLIKDQTSIIQRLERQLEFIKSSHQRSETRAIDLQAEMDRMRNEFNKRSERYEADVCEAHRRLSQLADENTQALHAKDLACERDRRQMRSELKARIEAESEARSELVDRVERDAVQKQALHNSTLVEYQRDLQTLREEKASVSRARNEERDHCHHLEASLEQLRSQHSLLLARFKSTEDEVLEERRSWETTTKNHRDEVRALEDQLNSERATKCRGDTEIKRLQAALSDLGQVVQTQGSTRDDDHSALVADIRRLSTLYEDALVQIKDVRQQYTSKLSILDTQNRDLSEQLERSRALEASLERQSSELRMKVSELSSSEMSLQRANELLQSQILDVQSQKQQHTLTLEQAARSHQEEIRHLQSKLSQTQRDIADEREGMANQIRTLTSESSLLRRELHRSEQETYEMSRQREGPDSASARLKEENSELRKKIATLHDTNSHIREQVVSMTEEMSRDPSAELAMQHATTISSLRHDLNIATNEIGRLVALLTSKDEEICRYQGDISGDKRGASPQEETVFWRQRCHSYEEEIRASCATIKGLERKCQDVGLKVRTLLKERDQLLSANTLLQHQLVVPCTFVSTPTTQIIATEIPKDDVQAPSSAVARMSADHSRRVHSLDKKIANVRSSLKYTDAVPDVNGKATAKIGSRVVRHYGFN